MTPELVFSLSSTLAMISWLFLVAAARWMPKTFHVTRILIPISLSLVYLLSLALAAPNLEGGFNSLADVSTLFQNDWALLAGWVHYLAFDFFVGCWILETAKQRGDPHWLLIPILISTFMLGPIGYLLFQSFGRIGLQKRLTET